MKRAIRPILFCVLVVPALPVAAQAMGEGAPGRPLDLSLPPSAPIASGTPPASGNTAALPDLGGPSRDHAGPSLRDHSGHGATSSGRGSQRFDDAGYSSRGGGASADLPYGAGYEARQGSGVQPRAGGRGR